MPSDQELSDFVRRMPRGDRERLARAVARAHAVEQTVVEQYSAMTARQEKRLEVAVRRGDGTVQAALRVMVSGGDEKSGLATFDSPDGKRLLVDGNTERRLAAARARIQGTVAAVMRSVGGAGKEMQAESRALAREHAALLGESEAQSDVLSAVNDRLAEVRDLIGDHDGEIADAEWQADQEPGDDTDLEETYNDDLAKLSALYMDSARGRIATWRNSPRVQTARNQIATTGMNRGSVANTVSGTARAAYRRAAYAEGIKRGATHAERRNVK